MDELLTLLIDAGYTIDIKPGEINEQGNLTLEGKGCVAAIMSKEYLMTNRRDQRWSAYGDTPPAALLAAAALMRKHLKPSYEAYVDLANTLGWEK